MSLRKAKCRFTSLLAKLIIKAEELGFEIAIDGAKCVSPDSLMAIAEAEGVHLPLQVARKMAGHRWNSLHYQGLAADFNLYKDGVYMDKSEAHEQLGEYWESLDPSCSNGRDFSDGNHYSYRIDNRR